MTPPLTIRVEEGRAVVSDDEGRSVALDARLATQLEVFWDANESAASRAVPSAGCLAALGEARQARPVPAGVSSASWRVVRDGARTALGPLLERGGAEQSLDAALCGRRSERQWGPPRIEDLAALLVMGARVADVAEAPDGYVTSHRPAPSAGGRHPCDLHLLVGETRGIEPGEYAFDALTCELVRVGVEDSRRALAGLGEILEVAPPPVAVVLVAHTARTLERYPAGLSLLWRDSGALLATLQLVATSLGLASCIVGSCGIHTLERSPLTVDVGALALGSRPDAAPSVMST